MLSSAYDCQVLYYFQVKYHDIFPPIRVTVLHMLARCILICMYCAGIQATCILIHVHMYLYFDIMLSSKKISEFIG